MQPVESRLQSSFDYCARVARKTGRNFYFSFLTLPQEKRRAMCVIYAWMRKIDDLADDSPSPKEARKSVSKWMEATHLAYRYSSDTGGNPSSPIPLGDEPLWPAFQKVITHYAIPLNYFDEIAEGALMDQEVFRYPTFQELYRYCYRVASVVGLVCLKVFGYQDSRIEQPGESLGIAFQLTNILRDVKEDASRNRIYIPQEDLQCFGVSEEEILHAHWSERMRALFEAFAQRAEDYYHKALPCMDLVSSDARPTLRIMYDIYAGILAKIRSSGYQVFDTRASVPTWKKFYIVLKNRFF